MMMREPLAFAGLRGTLARNASLARHTSWRVGGTADLLYTPADRDDLAAFLRGLPAGARCAHSDSSARFCRTGAARP